jgi:hypothetical protein
LNFRNFVSKESGNSALSVIRWGEPRATQDIDATLLTGFGNEESYIFELLGKFRSRIPDATDFALEHRVLLLRSSNETDMDISLGAIPFEEEIIRRATPFLYTPEAKLITCSSEDLVVLKAFASRIKDWIDVEGIILRQKASLDWNYILRTLQPLCELKEDPGILQKLKELRQSLDDK